MTTWLILGSGPSMPRYSDWAFSKADIVATTNFGIVECAHQNRRPDWYGIFTPGIENRYGRFIDQAIAEGMLTLGAVWEDEALPDTDRVLILDGQATTTTWVPGRYIHAGSSGAMLVQFAVNSGADHVILCGFDGYRAREHVAAIDTCDGRHGPANGMEATQNLIGPALRSIIHGSPAVEFIVCGIDGYGLANCENVEVYDSPGCLIEDEENTGTWLVLGSSLSMPLFASEAFARADKIATTNAGIYECVLHRRYPDIYGILEVETPGMFGRYYQPGIDAGETTLVTASVTAEHLVMHGKPRLPQPCQVVDFVSSWKQWQPGEYCNVGATGALLLQWAVNHGADRVLIVGMEGYVSDAKRQVVDTFDGRIGHRRGASLTAGCYGRFIARLVEMCPEIDFEFFGDIKYELPELNNVQIVRSVEAANAVA